MREVKDNVTKMLYPVLYVKYLGAEGIQALIPWYQTSGESEHALFWDMNSNTWKIPGWKLILEILKISQSRIFFCLNYWKAQRFPLLSSTIFKKCRWQYCRIELICIIVDRIFIDSPADSCEAVRLWSCIIWQRKGLALGSGRTGLESSLHHMLVAWFGANDLIFLFQLPHLSREDNTYITEYWERKWWILFLFQWQLLALQYSDLWCPKEEPRRLLFSN